MMSKPKFSIRTLLWMVLVVSAFFGGRASMQPVVDNLRAVTGSLTDQLAWHKSALENVLQLHRADQQKLHELRAQSETAQSNNIVNTERVSAYR